WPHQYHADDDISTSSSSRMQMVVLLCPVPLLAIHYNMDVSPAPATKIQ
ncbi:unnamed protein product, partial [Urochloa humidicola]